MASPPYRSPATSPPYPSSATLPNPKKRPSLSVTSHPPGAKRRKPTNASQASTPATSHPLRQTSFPPEESAIDIGERSPSVESDVTGITGRHSVMTSGTHHLKGKKRGRKRKTEDASVMSGGNVAAVDAVSGGGQLAEEAEEDDDDADENEGVLGDQDKQRKRKEKADLAFLIEHFNHDQLQRYEAMRRIKLRKETVRRIVNQTLSQSVPPAVITGINGYMKLFVGLLIEGARDVQEQNAAVAAGAYPSPPPRPQSSRTAESQTLGTSTQDTILPSSFESTTTLVNGGSFAGPSVETPREIDSDTDRPPELNHNDIFGTSSTSSQAANSSIPSGIPGHGPKPLSSPPRPISNLPADVSMSSPPGSSRFAASPPRKPAKQAEEPKAEYLGPLLPGDFRDAYRRHKRNGEGAGIGMGSMSLMGMGVQGTFAAPTNNPTFLLSLPHQLMQHPHGHVGNLVHDRFLPTSDSMSPYDRLSLVPRKYDTQLGRWTVRALAFSSTGSPGASFRLTAEHTAGLEPRYAAFFDAVDAITAWISSASRAAYPPRSALGAAAPTWPSSMDELEDIMMLNTGYRARAFAAPVTPCGFSANGPGRITAAEWVRTAFHDMATGNVYLGNGGLDASIVFELGGDNPSPDFDTTLTGFVPFLSSRSSMSDIIAMGMYAAVRSCGGPIIPVKTGRVDATEAGPPGVPQPQNSLFTFQNQFLRMGFDTSQMIAVVACGHTLGGVKSKNFPQVVPAGSAPNDFKQFDSTALGATAKFDEKIASDYVAGTSTDPLVVGPARSAGRDSDFRVFNADGNATISSMADPATFQSTCQAMLQKMIEVVPASVTLTDPIVPYEVKPVALQLTLQAGGSEIQFAGEIRVRTTSRPASQISSVQLVYKDRTGGNGCGTCRISTTSKGSAAGFDDSFTFYAFSSRIPSQSSISAFNVLITLASGSTELYDNNGQGYPIQDNVMLQAPQSCVVGNTLTVTAAVRSPATSANLVLSLKVPRTVITPELQSQTVAMTQQSTVGPYSILTGTYTLDSSQVKTTNFDLVSGQDTDSFKSTGDLGATCQPLGSGGSTSSTSSTSSSSSSSSITGSSSTTLQTSTRTSSSTLSTTTTSSSTPSVSGYAHQGCYTDSVSARVLTGRYTSSSTMTYKSCSSFCNGYTYWSVEYGSQCYCGQAFSNPTSPAPASDCSMRCSGDPTQNCGAGNRMNLFKSTQQAPTNATVPGYTLGRRIVGLFVRGIDFSFVGRGID
ncbi:MAG: hypothetical protein Q9216_004777 [Gyalolechia sp. 2 TL-2023]